LPPEAIGDRVAHRGARGYNREAVAIERVNDLRGQLQDLDPNCEVVRGVGGRRVKILAYTIRKLNTLFSLPE
jgi:hypothetical protein